MKVMKMIAIMSVMIILVSCSSETIQEESDNIQESATEEVATDSIGTFESVTIEGATISSDIFAEYELTMVNIWATWCSPCVNEMGELAELYHELPENVNLITICEDAESETELAKEILDTNEAMFDTVIVNDEMRTSIISRCSGFPTTLFIDSNGNIVDGAMVGAPSSDVVDTYLEQINLRLN